MSATLYAGTRTIRVAAPLEITPRLMVGARIGDAWVAVEATDAALPYGRQGFRWHIDLPDGSEFTGDDLSVCSRNPEREAVAALLGFLSAAGEAYGYRQRTGRAGENEDLFPPAVVAWAHDNVDIACLAHDLEDEPS